MKRTNYKELNKRIVKQTQQIGILLCFVAGWAMGGFVCWLILSK